jgi:tetrahydromethanopterin S-methyltransferase subunit A
LLLVGAEADGHHTGQTIRALIDGGVNERMRVNGSTGKRPVLRNLTRLEVERFRQQVAVINLIGSTDVSEILDSVTEAATHNPGPLAAPFQPPQVPRIGARSPERLRLDKSGFFIIIPQPDRGVILCEHYQNNGTPNLIIEGMDAATIYYTAIERGLVSQLDHASYLGKELAKAVLSMRLGFTYRQDAALGEVDPETAVEW